MFIKYRYKGLLAPKKGNIPLLDVTLGAICGGCGGRQPPAKLRPPQLRAAGNDCYVWLRQVMLRLATSSHATSCLMSFQKSDVVFTNQKLDMVRPTPVIYLTHPVVHIRRETHKKN